MSNDRSTDRVDRPRGGGWSPRLFATLSEEPRARRAGDVALLAGSSVGLAMLSLLAIPPARLESQLISIVAALPPSLVGLWRFLIGLITGMALVLVIVSILRRRWRLARDIVLAGLLSVLLDLVVSGLVEGSWEMVWAGAENATWVPWLRLTVPSAAVLVANPHLILSVRRLGWWLISLGAVGTILIGAALTLGLASVLIAIAAAAVVHLVFGSCRGRPDLAGVAADLGALGVETRQIGAADRQKAGVFLLEAVGVDGRRLDVKVYGRDAYDTQWLTTLWRTVWYRTPGAPVSPGRLQQVEHEAFLTLLAGQAGVLTQPVITAGLAPNEDAVLVMAEAGGPVRSWTEATAAQMWEMLSRLHGARIAHGQVDLEHLITDGSRMGLTDFRGARVSPDPIHRQIDRAQGLVTSALLIGTQPAVRSALDALGPEEIAGLLPFIQEDPLTPYQRDRLEDGHVDIDELRAEAATLIGAEPPELERLRRFTWGSVFRIGLPIFAFLALANVFAGLDLAGLADSLADASWWYVAVGAIIAQVPRVFWSVSTLGASPIAVPLSRLYVLQLAQAYIALTIPGGAARIALNVRFFQRHGLAAGSALAVGALDSFALFIGQISLLGLVLVFSSATVDLDLDSDTTSGLVRLLVVVVGIALVLLLMVILIPRLRHLVLDRLRRLWGEALSALRGLASPRRLGMLLGGNIGGEVMLAVALWAFTIALGEPVGLPELLLINITVSLFAGIMPVPGGIGVVESALIFGLARAGMSEPAAFAAAIMHRAATFYLPPIWGFIAFRWLERGKHL